MLQSKRLKYRKFTYDDFEDLFEVLGDEETCKYLPGNGVYSKDHVDKWLAHFIRNFKDEQGNEHYAIVCKETDKVIGYGGIGYVKEFENIEIMYGLNRKFWGKGYGTEVSLFFKEYAKSKGLQFLIALADIRNIGSQKILEKTGFNKIKQMDLWGLEVYYYEMEI